jgi:hypothetical protein
MTRVLMMGIGVSLLAAACGTVVPLDDACVGDACWSCDDVATTDGITKTVCSTTNPAAQDGAYDCPIVAEPMGVSIRMDTDTATNDDADGPPSLANATSAVTANLCPRLPGSFHCNAAAGQVACELPTASATSVGDPNGDATNLRNRAEPGDANGALASAGYGDLPKPTPAAGGAEGAQPLPSAPAPAPMASAPMRKPGVPVGASTKHAPEPSAPPQPLLGTHGERCAQDAAFWLAHPRDWPVSGFDLGFEGYNQHELESLLATPPGSVGVGDASIVLGIQLAAALLNRANGVADSAIDAVIGDAQVWIQENTPAFTRRLPFEVASSTREGKVALALAAKLAAFNRLACP